jgi:hypothetical protein
MQYCKSIAIIEHLNKAPQKKCCTLRCASIERDMRGGQGSRLNFQASLEARPRHLDTDFDQHWRWEQVRVLARVMLQSGTQAG